MSDMDDELDQLGYGPWSSKFRVRRIRDMAFHCNQGIDDPTCQLKTLRIANLVEQQGLELEPEQALVMEPTAEVLLQSRTVSQDEVRRNLQEWVPAMGEELQALVQNHEAMSHIIAHDLKTMEENGVVVQLIPSKMVFTLKSPDRRHRARLVACGNYIPRMSDTGSSLEGAAKGSSMREKLEERRWICAIGFDSDTLRIQLRYAAGRTWRCFAIDIKTAFLLAPARQSNGSRIVIKPPRILIDANLISSDTYFLIERAMYGLQTSPADWQEFRKYRALRQAISDASLWFVMAAMLNENGVVEILNPEGEVLACMGVYVDDLLVSRPDEELDALKEKLMSVWKTSNPSDIDHGMKFCGIEVEFFWMISGTTCCIKHRT